MTKVSRPKLDEPTRKVLAQMLSTPPKPHDKMKVGKKPDASKERKNAKTVKRDEND